MAKYIEEQEILWRMTNALDEQDTYLPIHFREMVIDECNASDVIERSEYEKVLEENKQLKHIISDKVDKDLKCAFEVKELRSKIDNAIEELRKEIEENHLNVIDYADGEWIVKDFVYGAIERFKRNIGE